MPDFKLLQWAIPALFVILIIAMYVSRRRFQNIRESKLRYQAESLGYSYLERGDLSGLNDFHLFSQGRSKKIANILTGTYHHLPVKILDYSYIISSGENSSTKKQTVLIIESSSSALPDFELRPENLLDKIGAALGHNDIDIPSYPQFSKTYLLKGRDEAAIRSVFTDGVALYFSQNPGLCVAFNQGQFILYRAARLVNPIDLSTFLQQGYDIYRLFKA